MITRLKREAARKYYNTIDRPEWHVVKPTLYWDIFHGGDTHEIDVEAL
jgi:hypothetical protein